MVEERRHSELRQTEKERTRWKVMMEFCNLMILDAGLCIESVSKPLFQLLGHEDDSALVGESILFLLNEEESAFRGDFRPFLPLTLKNFCLRKKDGRFLRFDGKVLQDENSKIILNIVDTTERIEGEEEAIKKSKFDDLTGLLLHSEFNFLAERDLVRAVREKEKQKAVYLYIDIDEFGAFNDQRGHQQGDSVLKYVAQTLRETFRKCDIIGRRGRGSDEFMVLAAGIYYDDIIITEMRHRIENRLKVYTQVLETDIRLSIGYSFFDPDTRCSLGDLEASAESKMYIEKRKKKLLVGKRIEGAGKEITVL